MYLYGSENSGNEGIISREENIPCSTGKKDSISLIPKQNRKTEKHNGISLASSTVHTKVVTKAKKKKGNNNEESVYKEGK